MRGTVPTQILFLFNRQPYDGTDVTWNGLRLAEQLVRLGLDVPRGQGWGIRGRRLPDRNLPAVIMGLNVSRERLFAAAARVLRAVGVEAGQTCLDFGCGHGNYTIPLARLVGPTGEVLALDRDERALETLTERARQAGVANVRTLPSSGEPALPLEDASVDVTLLYDVLHDHYFSPEQRAALFEEVGRVSRPGGRLSVFPHHMTDMQISHEVIARARRLGFEKVDEYNGPLVHDDGITDGCILMFCKVDA